MKLIQFDPKSKCPKCGNTKVSSHYEGPIEEDPCWFDRTYKPVNFWPKHEFVRRTCDRCRYTWPQAAVTAGDRG